MKRLRKDFEADLALFAASLAWTDIVSLILTLPLLAALLLYFWQH